MDTIRDIRNLPRIDGKGCTNVRAGIHYGKVAYGVIGDLNPRFVLVGDTMNQAARMEQHSSPGNVRMSEDFIRELDLKSDNLIEMEKEVIEVKGLGILTTFISVTNNEDEVIPSKSEEDNLVDAQLLYDYMLIGNVDTKSRPPIVPSFNSVE
jgi:class 3 adenylate cyclase